MIFTDEIIKLIVGEDELIKNVEFSSEDLIAGETISTVDSVAVSEADSRWEVVGATTDFEASSNGASGTVAQLKITKAAAAGWYLIAVTVTTSEGQVLKANCRVVVE